MRVPVRVGLAVACWLLAAAPAWSAGVRANVAPGSGTVAVELLLDYDELTVDADAHQVVAQIAGLPIDQVAEPVQALFSAGLVLSWDDQIVAFQSFLFDPGSPATFQFTCPQSDPGCDDFEVNPEAGRMAFGIGLGHFDGIRTSNEVLLGTVTFQTLTAGDPGFALDVDSDNQFANEPRLRLLDFVTLLGIDLCSGQPVPDEQTAACLESLAFADVERVDELTLLTHYVPEPHASHAAVAALATLIGLRARGGLATISE